LSSVAPIAAVPGAAVAGTFAEGGGVAARVSMGLVSAGVIGGISLVLLVGCWDEGVSTFRDAGGATTGLAGRAADPLSLGRPFVVLGTGDRACRGALAFAPRLAAGGT
jgi:hypothetical protein